MLAITRRQMVSGAAIAAAVAAMPARAQDATTKKQKIVVCGGHPGDPEYGCGGTIARLTALGHEVTLLYLNEGDWPPTSAAVRLEEARKACEILKAKRLYAGQKNGHAIVDAEHYEAYGKALEQVDPDIVLTHWPIDNHRDHRACWNLTYDAWLQGKKKFALYAYEVSDGEDTQQFAPATYIDISTVEAIKRAACYAHASQTPDRYYAMQDQVAAFRGMESGSKRAEAFLMLRGSSSDLLAAILR
jgi:N-acetylglucosamine malate deacetylase 1